MVYPVFLSHYGPPPGSSRGLQRGPVRFVASSIKTLKKADKKLDFGFCGWKILKLKSDGRVWANYEKALKRWEQTTCIFFTFSGLSKRLILRFKMALFGEQNGSSCRAKRAILRCKTGHSENRLGFFGSFVWTFYRFRSVLPSKNEKKSCSFFW